MEKLSLWETEEYCEKARQGSLDDQYPAMQRLIKLARKAKKVLDLGCGEGTRLRLLCSKKKKCVGVDISKRAIMIAKKNNSSLKFIQANLEKLPLQGGSFDLVFSAFVLEHLDNPEKMIKEAVRVCQKGGKLVLFSPNYGSPNRASPPFKGSRLKKLFFGLINDLGRMISQNKSLKWNEVSPIIDKTFYQLDQDVKVEPYLGTLVGFLESLGMKMISRSSLWEQELPGAKLPQKIFSLLGKFNLYPFVCWGPHLFIVAEKV